MFMQNIQSIQSEYSLRQRPDDKGSTSEPLRLYNDGLTAELLRLCNDGLTAEPLKLCNDGLTAIPG